MKRRELVNSYFLWLYTSSSN